jgi:hypothetical protein
MQQRVPDNLLGESFRTVRKNTDQYNNYMAQDMTSYTTVSSGFPLTTNQDFHGHDVWKKSQLLNNSKKNNKKKNVYNAYVNAMFNSGVFITPRMDQC